MVEGRQTGGPRARQRPAQDWPHRPAAMRSQGSIACARRRYGGSFPWRKTSGDSRRGVPRILFFAIYLSLTDSGPTIPPPPKRLTAYSTTAMKSESANPIRSGAEPDRGGLYPRKVSCNSIAELAPVPCWQPAVDQHRGRGWRPGVKFRVPAKLKSILKELRSPARPVRTEGRRSSSCTAGP
jgi:hypothetical protein